MDTITAVQDTFPDATTAQLEVFPDATADIPCQSTAQTRAAELWLTDRMLRIVAEGRVTAAAGTPRVLVDGRLAEDRELTALAELTETNLVDINTTVAPGRPCAFLSPSGQRFHDQWRRLAAYRGR